MEGRSLKPAIDGHEMGEAPTYAESLYSEVELGWAPLHAWRASGFKFIKAPKPELYDMEKDPSETTNRAADERARAEDLGGKLEVALRRPTPTATAAPAVDPEERSACAHSATRAVVVRYVAPVPPCATRRMGFGSCHDSTAACRRHERSRARYPRVTTVLQEDPGLYMARRTRAFAYAAAARHDPAIADLRVLDKEGQLTPEDAIVLGDNLRSAGRFEEASLILERAQRENPTFPQPLISLAEVRIQERKYDEASVLCERVLKLVPDYIEALRRLGDLALLREDLDAAGSRYARIVELDAGDVSAMTKLGVIRMRAGRRDEAMTLFRQAIERDASNSEALLYLAGALASAGRPTDALPYFERAINADPASTMALNGLGLTRLAVGDKAGAVAAFRQSLRLDPKQEDIARTLAELRP